MVSGPALPSSMSRWTTRAFTVLTDSSLDSGSVANCSMDTSSRPLYGDGSAAQALAMAASFSASSAASSASFPSVPAPASPVASSDPASPSFSPAASSDVSSVTACPSLASAPAAPPCLSTLSSAAGTSSVGAPLRGGGGGFEAAASSSGDRGLGAHPPWERQPRRCSGTLSSSSSGELAASVTQLVPAGKGPLYRENLAFTCPGCMRSPVCRRTRVPSWKYMSSSATLSSRMEMPERL